MGPRYSANLAHLVDAPHCIYVIWADEVPLYVGMTANWERRLPQHNWRFSEIHGATHSDVWEACSSRWEAELLERDTIRSLDPLHNREHSPTVTRMRDDWYWYSEWREAFDRSTWALSYRWALEYPVLVHALDILVEHGYAPRTEDFGPASWATEIERLLLEREAAAS